MRSIQEEGISLWQLFVLIFVFGTGTTFLVGVGKGLTHGVWLVPLIAPIFAIGLHFLYHFIINSAGQNKNFFQIIQICLGKKLGNLIIFFYTLYFLFMSVYILKNFVYLMGITMLEKTPSPIISITFILAVAYILYLGLDVLARLTELYFPLFFLGVCIVAIGLFFSKELYIQNLLPVLPDGIGPIFHNLFKKSVLFPYGEMIAFTVIFPKVIQKNFTRRVSIVTIIAIGLFLTFGVLLEILTLGPELRNRSQYPFVSTVREVEVLEFIGRVDILYVFHVMFGAFVKICVYLYAVLIGLETITNRRYRTFVYPFALLAAFLSIIESPGQQTNLAVALEFVFMLHIPYAFIFPVLLAVILWWKRKKSMNAPLKY
ncbi:GerAB/ArcD/ProY family transporter [Jeotgalibacillus marinus]|uniref:Endospore germination permease n=1 Tax=Jeotgalibacillus marinus TaxID=86667 RepID=A0ABV3Q4G0_9BACL